MTDRQKAFCEFYAACGNAAEAARRCGYSEKTARSQGQRLLTNADISKYVRELQEKSAGDRIASMTEVKELWTAIMRDGNERTNARLRAGELLARAGGAYLPGAEKEADGDDTPPDDEGTQIFLPWNGEGDFSAIELGNGEFAIFSGHEKDDIIVYLPREERGESGG